MRWFRGLFILWIVFRFGRDELVLSNWLYSFRVLESVTKVVVGLHQEDERS
jgi:hypothetical protein